MLSTFTYTVTNTSGDVNTVGSLPWAVNQANNVTHGLNYILFDIPGTGAQVISVSQTLSANEQVVIDGTSQPGYSGTPLISVQGNGSVFNLFQFQGDPTQGLSSSGSTIQGLDLYDYTGNGIAVLNNSGGCWIQNNSIGFYQDSAGTIHLNSSLFNYTTSVDILSSKNVIRNNTLSGGYNALVVGENPSGTWSGTFYGPTSIQNNMIGTDPTGMTTAAYGNTSDGILFGAGGSDAFVGPANVVSGNQNNAVEFAHSSNEGNTVFQNFIGTNANGSAALGNGHFGIILAAGAHSNLIGRSFEPNEANTGGNIVSGNAAGDILLIGASQNFVAANVVGLNSSQTAVLGTQYGAITIQQGSTGNVIEGNVYAGATQNGVVVSSATGNNISGNWIGESAFGTPFANGAFGIALLPGASFNSLQGNAFGANKFGEYYIDPQAVGNDIS